MDILLKINTVGMLKMFYALGSSYLQHRTTALLYYRDLQMLQYDNILIAFVKKQSTKHTHRHMTKQQRKPKKQAVHIHLITFKITYFKGTKGMERRKNSSCSW